MKLPGFSVQHPVITYFYKDLAKLIFMILKYHLFTVLSFFEYNDLIYLKLIYLIFKYLNFIFYFKYLKYLIYLKTMFTKYLRARLSRI